MDVMFSVITAISHEIAHPFHIHSREECRSFYSWRIKDVFNKINELP